MTCSLFQLWPIAMIPASISLMILSSPRVLWRFSIRVNLSINFWYMLFACPRLTEAKNTTTSDSNRTLDIFRSWSSGVSNDARHLWHHEGFFFGSASFASLTQQLLCINHETCPWQGTMFIWAISKKVTLSSPISFAICCANCVDFGTSWSHSHLLDVVMNIILFFFLR